MSNKKNLKKEVAATDEKDLVEKSGKMNPVTGKVVPNAKKALKVSTVSQIEASERSAVDAVKANSSRTVRGSSGLANTGTIISYD
jgi:hypothetical protein